MNKQNPIDKKRQLKQQLNDVDDEQVKKTLNYFDSILDQYILDQDIIEDKNIQNFYPQIKSTDGIFIQQNGTPSNHTITSSSSSSSSSAGYIPAPLSGHRFEPIHHIRRYTSENNLDQIPSSSSLKPKTSHSRPLQTTATSTDDLSIIPSQKHHHFNFIKKNTNLSSIAGSASLIDLSSIVKLSSRPRFRFVPPSNDDNILKEEPELEQQFQLKTIPSNQTSFDNQPKPSHKIVKPTVIIPPVPKSAPITRLSEKTNIHHENGNSAFKPHRSIKNSVSSKTDPIKRTESIQKSNAQVGITNPNNQLSNDGSLLHQQQSIPQINQSMLDLSSPEPVNKNRLGLRSSYESKPVRSNKSNGYHPYRPAIPEEPISKWNQPVNNPRSTNSLPHPGDHRSHQQTYSHPSYISTGIPSTTNNHRQQTYYNPVHFHKYHPSQRPIPGQPVYITSPAVTRNGRYPPSSSSNIYNFNQNISPRDGQSKRNPYRQGGTITSYF